MKKFCVGFLSLFALTISSCNFLKEKEKPADTDEEFIPVTEIQLNVTEVEIKVGESFKLEAKVLPENATNKNVKWSVNDQGKIEFFGSTGLIEGLKPGEASIKAMSEQNRNIYIECIVTVFEGQAPTQHVNYTYDNYTSDFGSENIAHIDSCPNSGTPKLLVIPIWFDDSSKYIQSSKRDNIITDINTAYFGEKGSTGWHSVSSFYQAESKGKCNLIGTVAPWYECGKDSSYYSSDNKAKQKTSALVKEATEYYFSHNTSDPISDYDSNGDRYLDGVILIYGAPDYKQQKDTQNNLWAYCHWIQQDPDPSRIIPNSFFWASYDFMYDNNRALGRVGSAYGSGSCKNVTLDTHTFIHETGHLFGLEDYYCYNGLAHPAGAFSMQDYNVGGHDPFSLFSLGWLNPFYPKKSCEITLKPFQDGNHQSILLTPSFNMYASAFDEYLLLEFYTPTGLNKLDIDTQYLEDSDSPRGVNAYGIRLWHIDARLTYNKYKDTEGKWVYSSELINSPKEYTKNINTFGIRTAMSNTYFSSAINNNNDYCSPLGDGYYQFNLLELIRKQSPNNELPKTIFDSSSLYVAGDEFDLSTHKQFKNRKAENGEEISVLNNGKKLGYKFKVKSITTENNPEAVVEIIKL